MPSSLEGRDRRRQGGTGMIVDERLREELKEIETRFDNIRGYL